MRLGRRKTLWSWTWSWQISIRKIKDGEHGWFLTRINAFVFHNHRWVFARQTVHLALRAADSYVAGPTLLFSVSDLAASLLRGFWSRSTIRHQRRRISSTSQSAPKSCLFLTGLFSRAPDQLFGAQLLAWRSAHSAPELFKISVGEFDASIE